MNASFTAFIYGLILCVGLSLGSCNLFKKTPIVTPVNSGKLDPVTANKSKTNTTTPKYTPVTDVETTIQPLPDTVRWCDTIQQTENIRLVICFERVGNTAIQADTVAVLDSNPSIIQPTILDPTIRKKLAYRVVVMLPFMSKNFVPASSREIPGHSIKAIEFYEGVMMALDTLKAEGVNLFVEVYDTQRDTSVVKKLLESRALQEADLILGPLMSDNLSIVAEFAKANKKVLVSPLNSRSHITSNNPYFLQINPSFDIHSKYMIAQLDKIKNLAQYRSKKSEEPNYLILALEKDYPRVQQLQADYAISKNKIEARMPTLIRQTSSISINDIRPLLQKDRLNIIVMPTYQEEVFVYNSLREIQKLVDKVERYKGYSIAVVGMDRWRYYGRINFEYYEYLNLHFSSEFCAPNTGLVHSFKRDYKALYGIGSREFSLKGFDIMLYCGRMLQNYGTSFQAHLSKEKATYRHTTFDLQPVYEPSAPLDSPLSQQKPPIIRHYVNQYLNVLEFKNYELNRAEAY